MIWLDAQLPPRLAQWLREDLGYDAQALRELGLKDAEDQQIFDRGRKAKAVILTKDKDFTDLVGRFGPPPAVLWLRCGNTSEPRLKQILSTHLGEALAFIESGDSIVEIQ